MPATNYTPIQLYRTNTASTTAPSAVNLNAGELALNYNDSGMILFAKNTTGNVIKLMNNPANLLYPTADGSAGQFITTNGSGTLSFATGASLNTPLTVIGNATAGAEIRLPEDTDNGSNYVAIKAPDNIASNATLTAPAVTDTIAVLGTAQTFTATQTFGKASQDTKVAMGANNIDLSQGNWFTKTITTTTTLTVSNVPSTGTTANFVLDLTNGGSSAITWWSGVKWVGGTAPTLTSSGRDALGFYTYDGGTIWTGLVLGKDIK